MGEGGQMTIVLNSWQQVVDKLASFIPQLVLVLLVLIIGVVVAKVIEKLVIQVLKIARFDVLSEKSGIASILAKGEIKHSLAELIGMVIYWLLVLVFVIIALNMLSPEAGAAAFLDQVAVYAGKVVLALFVLILGLFFAAMISTIVRTTASNAGIATAKNLGQIAQTVIIVITVLTVLPMVGVRTLILDTAILVALAAVGLATGLAFGLGSKDIAGKIMQEIVEKWKKR